MPASQTSPLAYSRRRIEAARWVSIAGHPFAMLALLAAVAAMRHAQSAYRGVLLVVLAIVPVAALMTVQVRRGRWANIDASNASERPLLFAVALATLAVLLAGLLLSGAEGFLIKGIVVNALLLVLAALLTPWIKLSLHLMFAGMATTALTLAGSRLGVALIGLLPLLAWSRLTLSRHTPRELLLGLTLGICGGLALVRA